MLLKTVYLVKAYNTIAHLYIRLLTRMPTLGSYVLYKVLVCCRIISNT